MRLLIGGMLISVSTFTGLASLMLGAQWLTACVLSLILGSYLMFTSIVN